VRRGADGPCPHGVTPSAALPAGPRWNQNRAKGIAIPLGPGRVCRETPAGWEPASPYRDAPLGSPPPRSASASCLSRRIPRLAAPASVWAHALCRSTRIVPTRRRPALSLTRGTSAVPLHYSGATSDSLLTRCRSTCAPAQPAHCVPPEVASQSPPHSVCGLPSGAHLVDMMQFTNSDPALGSVIIPAPPSPEDRPARKARSVYAVR
jgi:hypothetical protein